MGDPKVATLESLKLAWMMAPPCHHKQSTFLWVFSNLYTQTPLRAPRPCAIGTKFWLNDEDQWLDSHSGRMFQWASPLFCEAISTTVHRRGLTDSCRPTELMWWRWFYNGCFTGGKRYTTIQCTNVFHCTCELIATVICTILSLHKPVCG